MRWPQLEREHLVLVQSSGSVGSHVNRSLADADIHVSWTHRVNQLVTAAGLVEAGFGVGVMSDHSAQHLASVDVVIREVSQPRLARPLCLLTRKGHDLSPAARDLRERILANRKAPTRSRK